MCCCSFRVHCHCNKRTLCSPLTTNRFPLLGINKHLCSFFSAHTLAPTHSLARFHHPQKRYAQSIFDLRRYKCRYTTIANLSIVWQLCSVLCAPCCLCANKNNGQWDVRALCIKEPGHVNYAIQQLEQFFSRKQH